MTIRHLGQRTFVWFRPWADRSLWISVDKPRTSSFSAVPRCTGKFPSRVAPRPENFCTAEPPTSRPEGVFPARRPVRQCAIPNQTPITSSSAVLSEQLQSASPPVPAGHTSRTLHTSQNDIGPRSHRGADREKLRDGIETGERRLRGLWHSPHGL
jgi:hypothetical protein